MTLSFIKTVLNQCYQTLYKTFYMSHSSQHYFFIYQCKGNECVKYIIQLYIHFKHQIFQIGKINFKTYIIKHIKFNHCINHIGKAFFFCPK